MTPVNAVFSHYSFTHHHAVHTRIEYNAVKVTNQKHKLIWFDWHTVQLYIHEQTLGWSCSEVRN